MGEKGKFDPEREPSRKEIIRKKIENAKAELGDEIDVWNKNLSQGNKPISKDSVFVALERIKRFIEEGKTENVTEALDGLPEGMIPRKMTLRILDIIGIEKERVKELSRLAKLEEEGEYNPFDPDGDPSKK
ncbi:MAG: hypothetical protein ABH833_02420 [Parcubacteria group bacterium]